jgi:hypothetical protein
VTASKHGQVTIARPETDVIDVLFVIGAIMASLVSVIGGIVVTAAALVFVRGRSKLIWILLFIAILTPVLSFAIVTVFGQLMSGMHTVIDH